MRQHQCRHQKVKIQQEASRQGSKMNRPVLGTFDSAQPDVLGLSWVVVKLQTREKQRQYAQQQYTKGQVCGRDLYLGIVEM